MEKDDECNNSITPSGDEETLKTGEKFAQSPPNVTNVTSQNTPSDDVPRNVTYTGVYNSHVPFVTGREPKVCTIHKYCGILNKFWKNPQELSSSAKNFLQNRGSYSVCENDMSKVVLGVTSVTSVTNKAQTEQTEQTEQTKQVLEGILTNRITLMNNSLLENIILVIKKNQKPTSIEDISEALDKRQDSIRVTIQRHLDFFQVATKDQNAKLYELTPRAELYIQNTIQNYIKAQEQSIKSLSQQEQELKNKDELFNTTQKIWHKIHQEIIQKSIYLDFQEILEENPAYATHLLEHPDETIEMLENQSENLGEGFKIRFMNLPPTHSINIENLRENHMNKLIMIEGRCVSLSSVRPIIKQVKYECPTCGTIITMEQYERRLRSPQRCSCGRRGGFKVLRKKTVDAASVMLEDLQERTEHPNLQRVQAKIEADLTKEGFINTFSPGNEVRIVGILREVPTYVAGAETTELGWYFEIIHGELFEPEINLENFSEEDKKTITDLSSRIDNEGMEPLVDSFAPDIHGYEDIKKAIILQACCRRNNPKLGKERNKPNILLIGDPGVAKSVLGNFAMKITVGSRKAVGGGSSAVGITASVVKEEESKGGYRIEPGALVLAKELLFIDELNNLSEDDKPKLQEGMSEQQVSINKANLHVHLKVTSGILATANPKYGSFDIFRDVNEQFDIPLPIINRFDELFIMKDSANKDRDELIAHKVIERSRKGVKGNYTPEFLRKFFVWIRSQEDPLISDEMLKLLQKVYSEQRKYKTDKVLLNARFLEALLRLVKASARLRMSKNIEIKDVKIALQILSKSHYQTQINIEELEVRKI